MIAKKSGSPSMTAQRASMPARRVDVPDPPSGELDPAEALGLVDSLGGGRRQHAVEGLEAERAEIDHAEVHRSAAWAAATRAIGSR